MEAYDNTKDHMDTKQTGAQMTHTGEDGCHNLFSQAMMSDAFISNSGQDIKSHKLRHSRETKLQQNAANTYSGDAESVHAWDSQSTLCDNVGGGRLDALPGLFAREQDMEKLRTCPE